MVNDGWNLKWKAGDQVGLVWVNAPEIQQQFTGGKEYDPTVLPNTAFWASNTRMTCNDPDHPAFQKYYCQDRCKSLRVLLAQNAVFGSTVG